MLSIDSYRLPNVSFSSVGLWQQRKYIVLAYRERAIKSCSKELRATAEDDLVTVKYPRSTSDFAIRELGLLEVSTVTHQHISQKTVDGSHTRRERRRRRHVDALKPFDPLQRVGLKTFSYRNFDDASFEERDRVQFIEDAGHELKCERFMMKLKPR